MGQSKGDLGEGHRFCNPTMDNFKKVTSAVNVNALWQKTVLPAKNGTVRVFMRMMMVWRSGKQQVSSSFTEIRMICLVVITFFSKKKLLIYRFTLSLSVPSWPNGCSRSLVPTLRLLSQRTSALGHTSCTQQRSGPACGFGTALFILPTPTSTQWPVCGYPAHIWPEGPVPSEKGYLM